MNKNIIVISIILIIIIFSVSFSINLDEKEKSSDVSFHVTLANPELYSNDVYSHKFSIDAGTYFFRFVPNGSSPELLSIKLIGQNYKFEENFILIGIPHESETVKYFTWKYEGNEKIIIDSSQEITIIINPNGNVSGSVSVDLIKKKA
ncbi:MAG: hypothetical protein O3B79_03270 [Crenarchaeota archaeon]|nr:hypothetical protein [Thermoproteota archaeon]HJJ24141.1 hypothetical protein [Nitrosopumilus sp.]